MPTLLMAASLACGLLTIAGLTANQASIAARIGAPIVIVSGEGGTRFRVPQWVSPAALGVVAGGAGLLIAGPVAAAAALAAAIGVPVAVRRRSEKRETSQLFLQLGDGVGTIAAGLRAGLSLSQSLQVAADESSPPLSVSLRSVVDREAMGVPLDRSLDEWATEHDGADVRLVSTVFRLHRRSGGDLPAVLDGVAATLRERAAQTRESQSLTAQARLSGMVLGFLPIGFFCFLSVMSPQDMSEAFRAPAGIAAMLAGILLQAGAFLWIRHLLQVGE